MPEHQIKVLIVDDSPVAREFLRHIIESDPSIKVIGYATDGEKALQMLQTITPDVITMDIAMPNLDGFETTRRIMQSRPIPVVIVSGIYSPDNVQASFHAIEAGALAILPRPVGLGDPHYEEVAKSLIDTIKTASGVKLITRYSKAAPLKQIGSVAEKVNAAIEAVAIGASLGGPSAIEMILSELPGTFPVPIFIVQHISNGFALGFANWLQKSTQLKVQLAQNKEMALPGHVYIASDGFHMQLSRKNEIALIKGKNRELCPAVSRLFSSIATVYGPNALGVVLTGMGNDGAEGLLMMKQKGAYTLIQDPDSCIMYSMPRAAFEIGASKNKVPLERMASTIEYLVHTSRSEKEKL
ncbi:chemotaxis-specific protein-glutamate methyltransferase CheB [Candidatus Protochlamydia phocaeensis]|uniref:chemotaxis-specific protein-glutamate methyltransferase CheB n=1 Tax=Candidatus Protochlamydia phocaeensis TaxID=1414722 RepID=UPI000837CD1F|nr:chemotaxis-specific protein-glutamate methyltransferase CheB [Candidatus Protochlamydia phocaeensis]